MIQEEIKKAITNQLKLYIDKGLVSARCIDEIISDIRHDYFEYLRAIKKLDKGVNK